MKNIWVNGMMGVVVGDALGMPVQFWDRAELKKHPVKTMQGYGTYHMPPGTWSDDSSMTLCLADSIGIVHFCGGTELDFPGVATGSDGSCGEFCTDFGYIFSDRHI